MNSLKRVDIEIEKTDDYDIAEWLYNQDLTQSAKNNLAKSINCYLKYLKREYRIKLNRDSGEKDIFIPSDEERRKLIEDLEFSRRDLTERNRLLFEISFEAGLRSNEVRKLKFSQVRSENEKRYIRVKEGKGGKSRNVYISESLYNKINWFEKHYRSSIFIFDNGQGKPLSNGSIRRIVAEAKRQLGISKEFHHHSCRHYRAVELLKQGINTDGVREFLGHSSLNTTQLYLRGAKDQLYKELSSKDKHFKSSGGERNTN